MSEELTKVYLEGPMGEKFGKEWELDVSTPIAAVQLIDANVPGFISWVRNNARKYTHYQVTIEYRGGDIESLTEEQYVDRNMKPSREIKSIRFIPVIEGAGKWTNAIIGAIMFVYGVYSGDSTLAAKGLIMMASGIVSALLTPSRNIRLASDSQASSSQSLLSEAFDGPANTTQQGVPVPLIYGRLLVGSSVISAGLVLT